MHRIFYIAELVDVIVSETVEFDIAGSHHTSLTRSAYETIKSLGMTSKVFRESSLDAIWYTQTSLVPLLRSVELLKGPFPLQEYRHPSRLPFNSKGTWSTYFECYRPLTSLDLSTFLFYSSRIQSIHTPYRDHFVCYDVNPLALLPQTQVLFPALCQIIDSSTVTEEASFLLTAAGSSLVQYDRVQAMPFCLMEVLVNRLASLKILMMFVKEEHDIHHLCRVLEQARRLEELQLEVDFDVGADLWLALAAPPHLLILGITTRPTDSSTVESHAPASATPVFFSSLISLWISTWSPSVLELVKGSSFPSLVEFCINGNEPHVARGISLMQAIPTIVSAHSLQEIHLHLHTGGSDDFPIEPVAPSAICALFPLSGLRRVTLTCKWQWDLDGAVIDSIAHAWPKLEYLVLDVVRSWNTSVKLRLHDLAPLAFHSPFLEHLAVTVDPIVLLDDSPAEYLSDELPSLRQQGSSLRCLAVGSSAISTASEARYRIAAYLSGLFPTLEIITSRRFVAGEVDEATGRGWADAQTLLPIIHEVRRQERSRTLADMESEMIVE